VIYLASYYLIYHVVDVSKKFGYMVDKTRCRENCREVQTEGSAIQDALSTDLVLVLGTAESLVSVKRQISTDCRRGISDV